MKVSLFYLPSVGNKAQIEQGRVGLKGELYDQMLREISEQAKLADGLGYDSMSFTEHHFHVEGFEMSNNPVLLDLYIAMQTKRLRVGQLGIVLPTQNPIRVAEDIAMLDHMTGGRANAGFARGYQRRWVDIMAQQTHGIHGALPNQHDEIDAANRAAFEENFRIIKQAWTQDFSAYQGKYWRIPPGDTPWTLEATQRWGGGVENGIVKSVAVVPKPVQKPHPPIFQPFPSSPRCIPNWRRNCATSMPKCRASRAAKAWACCATSSSPTPMRRRVNYGATAATSVAITGSRRSGFRRGSSIRRPARKPIFLTRASRSSAPSIP
jgi:Luciferase-like monooxygenase